MATATTVISRSLRLLGVIATGETMTAATGADALSVLNAMLAEWHEAEIGLPDYSLDSLTDTLASDAADTEALSYALALRIAPEYGLSVPIELAAAGEAAMSRLRLRYFQPGRVDTALPSTRSDYYDIEAG